MPLSYECEKKPLKLNAETPGEVDFLCDLFKGRFSVTANVNHGGKIASVKIFDKSDSEGDEAAKREFKNLKTLKHEKMVSLLDAYETDKMTLLKFDALPGTDVVSYLAEKSTYSEQMVADITLQVLDALDYIQWRGRVYLNLEPANVLVCSGRSLGKTVQVKLANFETTQTVAKSGTQIKGTYNFDYAGKLKKKLMIMQHLWRVDSSTSHHRRVYLKRQSKTSSSIMQTCICFSAGNSGGSASFPSI